MALNKKKKEVVYDPWRPNFRNPEELPDTKAIRTDFLFNFVSIFLAVLLLGYAAFVEYNLQSYRSELAGIAEQLQKTETENNRNLALNGRFTKVSGVVKEVNDFMTVPYLPSELLKGFTEIRPEEMIMDSLNSNATMMTVAGRRQELRYQVVMMGTIQDSVANPASSIITDYQRTARQIEVLQPKLEEINLVRFARNDELGVFTFTLEFIINPKKES